MDLFVSRLGLPGNDPNSLVNLIDKMMTEPSKQVQEVSVINVEMGRNISMLDSLGTLYRKMPQCAII